MHPSWRVPANRLAAFFVLRDIFLSFVKEMIRGSVRMIDNSAQHAGLVAEVGDQGRKLGKRYEICWFYML